MVAPVTDTHPPTTSTTTLVSDFNVVKWYDSKYVINSDEATSL